MSTATRQSGFSFVGKSINAAVYNTMNRKQRIAVLFGIALAALMLLLPPYSYSGDSGGGFAGYGLIFDPQNRLQANANTVGIHIDTSPDVHISTSTLAVQCLFVAVVTGGFVFLFQTHKN